MWQGYPDLGMTSLSSFNSFVCDDCRVSFTSRKQFMLHRRNHFTSSQIFHKEKDFLQGVCPFCSLTFYFKNLAPDALKEVMRLRNTRKKGQKAKRLMECRYCLQCKTSFCSINEFLEHSKIVHGLDRPYQCKKCKFNSFRYHDLKRHSYVHENIKIYKCHLCPKDYNSKTSLDYHLLRHSGVKLKSYDCEFCGRKFPIPYLLKRHILTHAQLPKVYKCNLCPKEFGYKRSLQLHHMTHTGEKLYHCSICQKGFIRPLNYRRHMQGHNQIIGKVISCEYCEKQFLTSYLLKRHMITHADTKPFVCDICLKLFSRQETLNVHKRTHTGDFPYKCKECGKKFIRRGSYKRHQVIHIKPDQNPVSCEYCGKSFLAKYRLDRHLTIHTRIIDKPHHCPTCPKQFTRKQDLQNHLLSHEGKEPYSCVHCGKKFIKQRLLKNHLDPASEVKLPLKCRRCKNMFANKNCYNFHIRHHKKKYICEICERIFFSRDGFKNHLKQHIKKEEDQSLHAGIKEEL